MKGKDKVREFTLYNTKIKDKDHVKRSVHFALAKDKGNV
jgi:hypothetical protein